IAPQRQRRRLDVQGPARRDHALEPVELRPDPMPDAATRGAPHLGVPNTQRWYPRVADDGNGNTAHRVVLVDEERVIMHDGPLPLLFEVRVPANQHDVASGELLDVLQQILRERLLSPKGY